MKTLQKIIFPLTGIQKSLYYIVVDGYVAQKPNGLILDERSRVSFNSYFNSFYENYWRTYTKLSDLAIKFTVRGKGLVVIYRDSRNNGCYEVINQHFDNSNFQDVIVSVAEDVFEGSGRIFVDIISDDKSKVELSNIDYIAENLQEEQKRLTVGICTFNRESFVHKNLSNLVELSKSFKNLTKIFVVNQGNEFTNEKLLALLNQNSDLIQIIKQNNLGGTGGFTRTLFEASNGDISDYHLLMDDDVIIDSKVIQTAFNFASNVQKPIAVGGQMLDLLRPTIMHEYGGNVNELGYISGIFHNLDIANIASLWHFNQITKIDFNAWWFCMMPTQKIKEIDLPAPIFIRGDDQEYGLRLQMNGVETVGLPGVALWHEPFYIKVGGWQTYYDFRNRMILSNTYSTMKNESASQLFLKIYRLLLIHDYQSVKLILQAIRDFSKGVALFDESSDAIHARVNQLAKDYAPKSVEVSFKPLADHEAHGKWNTKNRRINFAKQTALLSTIDFSKKRPKHLWDRHVRPENVQCHPYIKSNGLQSYHYLYEPNRQLFRELLKEIVEVQQIYIKSIKNNNWQKIATYKQEKSWQMIFSRHTEQSDNQVTTQLNNLAYNKSKDEETYRDLVVLGSSSTEVFDYIFGNNSQYHPFWASAWSARGLRKSDNLDYVETILQNISRDSNILLNFGNVDTDYNLRYKITKENFSDFEAFTQEMVDGIVNLKNKLISLGFSESNIFAVFISPPVRLDYDYWVSDPTNCYPAPTHIRGKILWDYSKKLEKHINCINMLEILSDHVRYRGESDFYPALSGKYMRDVPDHHQDYIKTKDVIWEKIQHIEGILPQREKPLMHLYPHKGFHIDLLKQQGKPRPRTCID